MKIFIATILLILSFALQITFLVCLLKAKNKTGRKCSFILFIVSLMSIFYVFSLYCNSKKCFINLSVITHALLPILLYFFLRYIRDYVRQKKIDILEIILIVLIVIDVGMMLSNLIKPWMLEAVEIPFGDSTFYRILSIKKFWFHAIVCFGIGGLSLYLTIYEAVKAPKLFKVKYINLAIAETAVVIWTICFALLRKLPVDFSILIYMIIAFEFTYFTLVDAPRKLEHNIQNLLLNNISDGFIVFDGDKELFYTNKAIHNIFTEEEINQNYDDFIGSTINEPVSNDYIKYQKIINDSCHYYSVYHNKFVDNKGRLEAYYAIFYDTTFETKTRIDKEYNDSRDPLTGTFNRTEFKNAIGRMKKEKPNEDYYIVATNFEKFRIFNEVNGTLAGDDILIKMSRILFSIAMQYKIVFSRMGSDNFGICITKELFNKINLPNLLVDKFRQYESSYLKLKIGVCALNDRDIYDAFDKAIQTLHYYKNNDEQRCGFYVDEIKNLQLREEQLTKEFDNSINNDYFEVYLQPQINSRDNTVFGCEALCRWNHPTLGFISPGEFIPVFERNGLITKLDQYIWNKTAEYLSKLKDNEKLKDLSISVNVSKIDFFNCDVYQEFTELIDKYGLTTQKLKIEITESVFVSDQEKIISILEKLKSIGFTIEMDDFGSGFSSLNILKEIPLDVIKLDMRFLFNTSNYTKAVDVLESVISMSHRLKLHVIAEGIETKEQSDMLNSMNCALMQGFYYAKPMSIPNFEEFIKDRIVLPCLNDFSFGSEINYAKYKEADKYYGMYPFPIIVLKSLYDEKNELCDLKVVYQNSTFAENDDIKLGNLIGKNVSELKDGLARNRLNTYKTILLERKRYDFKDVDIDGDKFNVSLYPLADSDNVAIVFRSCKYYVN